MAISDKTYSGKKVKLRIESPHKSNYSAGKYNNFKYLKSIKYIKQKLTISQVKTETD